MLLVSCGDSDDKKQTQSDTTLEDARTALSIQTIVTKSDNSITLPSTVTGFSNVSVSWVSSNTTIITTDGTVTHQDGTGQDSVTLTATLTYNENSAKKTFTVIVYQNSKELTDDEVLAAAKAKFTFSYDKTLAYQEIEFPETITVDSNSVAVSCSSSNTKVIAISAGYAYITQQFSEKTVTLSQTFSYNGKTSTQELSVTVPAVTKFEYIEENSTKRTTYEITFDPTSKIGIYTEKKVYTDETKADSIEKTKFTYSLDEENEQITITLTALYSDETDGKWISVDELPNFYLNLVSEIYTNLFDALLAAEDEPTYENLYAFALIFNDKTEEEYSYEKFLTDNDFSKDDSTTTVTENVTKSIDLIKTLLQIEDVSSAKEAILAELSKNIALSFLSLPNNTVYDYEVLLSTVYASYPTGQYFKKLRACYDSSKEWYAQCGVYKNSENYSEVSISDDDFSFNNNYYDYDDGEWNESFTTFTYTDDEDNETTFTFTDNKDGTLTVSDGTTTLTLNFEGDDLIDD